MDKSLFFYKFAPYMTENNSKIKAVIFDLDGTLVNTVGDLGGAMNYTLRHNGRAERSLDECAAMIGNGVIKFAQRALGPGFEHLTEKVTREMMAYYLDHCTIKTVVYGGISQLVDALVSRGIFVAVLTNKDQPAADSIVAHFFPGTFVHVVGSTGGSTVKPDPEALLALLANMNVAPKNALMVGDSQPDIQVALAASVKPVAVTWGFRSCDQLKEAGAKIVINKPHELLFFV